MDAQKRKLEINLITLGTGVILFGLWTFIKFAVTTILFGTQIDAAVEENEMGILKYILWGAAIIEFLIRCYIGFSARAEGKGKHKRILYLIPTVIYILLYAASVFVELYALFTVTQDNFSVFVTLVIDVTSTVFLTEVLLYSVKLRKLKKAMAHKGGDAA